MLVRRLLLALMAGAALTSVATAGDWRMGVEIGFDRQPHDFSEPRDSKATLSLSRGLPSGIVLGGSVQSQVNVSGKVSYQVEGTLGYSWRIGQYFSFGGGGGVGEKLQSDHSGGDFPYYVFRVHADVAVDARWSWNILTYRFRDAFDPANDFNTPEVSTAISYKLDENRSVFAKYLFGWRDGDADHQGVGIGFHYSF